MILRGGPHSILSNVIHPCWSVRFLSSYFQGIWSGSWPEFMSPTTSQDVTINIGQETREKIFVVTYSWGAVTWARGFIPAGRIRTEGKEQDDKFHFQWENKQGRKFEVVLQKDKENVVKARIEKSGTSGPLERPFRETSLWLWYQSASASLITMYRQVPAFLRRLPDTSSHSRDGSSRRL